MVTSTITCTVTLMVTAALTLAPTSVHGHQSEGAGSSLLRIQNGAYVTLYPDMRPLQDQLTVCGWVRMMAADASSSGNAPRWFIYGHSGDNVEIDVTSSGYYRILSAATDKRRTVAPKVKRYEWHHHCLAWTGAGPMSTSSSLAKAYFDGENIANFTVAAGKRLNVNQNGFVGLGNVYSTNGQPHSSTYRLNGDVVKVDMYSRELSRHEIRAMFEAGICSQFEHGIKGRYLKWEEILKFYRKTSSSSVEEIPTDCPHTDDDDDNDGDDDDDHKNGLFSMLFYESLYNKILTMDTVEEVYQRVAILEEFVGVNMTTEIVEHLNKHH